MELELHEKPATRIRAKLVKELTKATLYDCEGDEVWVPNSLAEYEPGTGTLLVETWFYEKLCEEGKL